MNARGTSILLGCLALMFAALPATAAADPGFVVQEKSLHLDVPLRASDGYAAHITTAGHHQVSLTLVKGATVATYQTLGTVSRKGIRADFGRFGRINLHFRTKSKPQPQTLLEDFLPPRLRCRGRREVSESGVFRGRVRFAGVRDFTRIRGHRLLGSVERGYKVVCHLRRGAARASAAGKEKSSSLLLVAAAGEAGIRRFFAAVSLNLGTSNGRPIGFAIDFAGRRQKIGRVLVSEAALTFSNPLTDSRPENGVVVAKVALPHPFEGSARYRAEGKLAPTWEGNFGVRLPGRGLVPLAGPEFEPLLCDMHGEEKDEHCLRSLQRITETTARTLALVYGSGSHSQPLALARLSSLR
jgi:hypothetical protein